MSASQMWYVKHRPDLLLLSPCDSANLLDGAMFVSIDHLHSEAQAPGKWKHPQSVGYVTCHGDPAKQFPFVCKCACAQQPCVLRSTGERASVLEAAIPKNWAEVFEVPENFEVSEARKEQSVCLWLDCTGKVDRELTARIPESERATALLPDEATISSKAEVLFTDYLKGRVCFQCNLPSTQMQICARCRGAHYCSRECQHAHWGRHKPLCQSAAGPAPAPSS